MNKDADRRKETEAVVPSQTMEKLSTLKMLTNVLSSFHHSEDFIATLRHCEDELKRAKNDTK